MTTDQILAQARQNVVNTPGAAPAGAHTAALTGAANGNKAAASDNASLTRDQRTALDHLHNAATMYAQAAACFAGLYKQQVLAHQQQPAAAR